MGAASNALHDGLVTTTGRPRIGGAGRAHHDGATCPLLDLCSFFALVRPTTLGVKLLAGLT